MTVNNNPPVNNDPNVNMDPVDNGESTKNGIRAIFAAFANVTNAATDRLKENTFDAIDKNNDLMEEGVEHLQTLKEYAGQDVQPGDPGYEELKAAQDWLQTHAGLETDYSEGGFTVEELGKLEDGIDLQMQKLQAVDNEFQNVLQYEMGNLKTLQETFTQVLKAVGDIMKENARAI